MDLLATNHLGRAMHASLYDSTPAASRRTSPASPSSTRRLAHDFYPDWDGAADTCVAILRTEAGRDPHDKDLHDLVGELSTRSDDFRRRWSTHNVRYHGAGTKHFHHHDVGDLELAYESVDMISDPGLTLTLYAAEPASPTAHALDLLASWAATENLAAPERSVTATGCYALEPRSPRETCSVDQLAAKMATMLMAERPDTTSEGGVGMARIFVTGSTVGLGRAAAETLIRLGHQVVVHARNSQRTGSLSRLIGLGAEIVIGDLASEQETRALADQVNELGRMDAIIQNAGVYADQSPHSPGPKAIRGHWRSTPSRRIF